MTSEGLGEMFEGDSADRCTEKFPLVFSLKKFFVEHFKSCPRVPKLRI
jgi:hypothetical protein